MAQSGRRQQGLAPEDVQHHSFSPARRGYDVEEVQEFLTLVAGELRAVTDRERTLAREIDRLETRLKSAETRLSNRTGDQPSEVRRGRIDEAELPAALGAEAADILRSAHQVADEVTRRADEYAAKVV